jgi:hypothetical protein
VVDVEVVVLLEETGWLDVAGGALLDVVLVSLDTAAGALSFWAGVLTPGADLRVSAREPSRPQLVGL